MEQRPGQLSSSSQQPSMQQQQPPHEFLNSTNANTHNQASRASKDTSSSSSDWQEFTATDGRRYYYNKRTKQSSWEKPLELMTPLERADASTVWKEFTNAEGKKYYYNKDTKQSKWTIPDELKFTRELAEKEASRGTQSPATLTTSIYDQPSASVSSANEVSSSNATKMSKKGARCLATTSVGSNKVCGKTRNVKLRKRWEKNGKRPLPVEFDKSDQNTYRPVGDNADDLITLKNVAGTSRENGNVMGWDTEFPDDFDFTYCDQPEAYKPPKAKATRASTTMKSESHPWLQFRDADKNEKILCLNRLAEIQDYPVEKPRRIDWSFLNRIREKEAILNMIQVLAPNNDSEWVPIDLWGRIFGLDEPAIREWCLEFYSTLRVDPIVKRNEITQKQTIHFRLGGKQRHCTAMGFAYLTGMLQKSEMREEWVYTFMVKSIYVVGEFWDNVTMNDYWYAISGERPHNSQESKASQIRSKQLRVLHKMITYSFLHRGDNNNKVYAEDLWLLRFFSESTSQHALAPYILARHMSQTKEKRLLCGHFISKIVRQLGLGSRSEHVSNPVNMGLIGELDFVKSKLLTGDKTRLLADDEAPAPAARQRRRKAAAEPKDEEEPRPQPQTGSNPYDFSALRGDLQRLTQHMAFMIEQQRYLNSVQDRMSYIMDYYRPVWQHQMEEMYRARPDQQMPSFHAPDPYIPRQSQSDYPYPPHTSGGASGSQPYYSSSYDAGGSSAADGEAGAAGGGDGAGL